MGSRYIRTDHLFGLAIMAAFLAALYLLLPASWTGPWKLARQFDVPRSMIHWREKPKDCDYLRSPLGDKGCHFKLSVAAYNSAGELVAGDGAPLFRDDPATKQSEVSFDGGNSWHPRGRDTSNAIARVLIRWVKVDD
jgi:hypothetical protein